MKTDSANPPGGPLLGVRVIELGRGVGTGFAARLLADLGATVVRVGRSDRTGPLAEALRRSLDRGKLDVAGRDDELADLRDWCDILITPDDGGDAGLLARLTAGAPARQVVVRVSEFGLDGPRSGWRGTELLAAAYGGGCQMNGEPGRAPLRPPPFVADHELGVNVAIAALLGRIAARRDGVGQDAEVSSVDSWATVQTAIGTLEYIFQGRVAMRAGRRFGGRAYPYTMLACADGEIRLICLQGREWARSLEMMGSPAWGRDPRFANRMVNQAEHADELDGLIEQWLAERDKDDVLADAIKHKVPWVPVRLLDEVRHEPQLRHRDFFWADGELELPGVPAVFSRTQPVPPAAEDRDWRGAAVPEPAAVPRSDPPLSGLTVLDFGWAWAGGVVGSVLADFGADVIKIESQRRLDPMRMDRPLLPGGDSVEQSGLHHNVNRNKRSLAVDVTTVEGADLVRRLAAGADVLVENFSPGALDRQGLGPAALTALNPGLVYLSVGAVGADGPLTGVRAYAPVLTALSGVDALVGYPGEPPLGLQHGLADPNAGLFGVLCCLAALLEREHSGRGQHVDLSQLEALVSLLGVQLAAEQLDPGSVAPLGDRDPRMTPHGIFRCLGEDRWVAIACPDDAAWRALADAMGGPDDPALATAEGRREREVELEDAIGRWTATLTPDEAAERIQRAGGYAAPLLDTADRFADPHLQARGTYVAVEHPVVGTEFVYGPPWRLGRTPGSVRTAAPLLGQHTDEILGERLGLPDDEIARLREKGVLT
jgi:crotonobetainyl-CoA:carnitine CoA-transferase CaiB-like acyl-CoA transferase